MEKKVGRCFKTRVTKKKCKIQIKFCGDVTKVTYCTGINCFLCSVPAYADER